MQKNGNQNIFTIPAVRAFILFRLFFNARFYYPVFTILFLDFGLTLEQFAVLNAVWAATIVLLEVPSGALADVLGRKPLLVGASVLMVGEIALLCLLPRSRPDLLFPFFLLNRLLSGTAEAAASGADEALAYDALKAQGKEQHWPTVLAHQMHVQSIGFMVAMSVGAAVYDPAFWQFIADKMAVDLRVPDELALRLPLVLTLLMAVMALLTTFKMTEFSTDENPACHDMSGCSRAILTAFKTTLQAGMWILKTPFALVVILTGLVFDHVVRMLITLTSQYFRLIALPEATFGLIGSGMALMGLFIPRLAARWVKRYSPLVNLEILTLTTMMGLVGLTLFVPFLGVIPMLMLAGVMFLLNFYVSHYLNQITPSAQRATVLSFKGFSMNLAYGAIGLMYSALLAFLRRGFNDPQHVGSLSSVENEVFVKSIGWFPWYFLAAMVLLVAFAAWRLRHSRELIRGG